MPFGISSAPEVWQQKMNELVEGLSGMEVIAYDFLISGFGANTAEATVAMTAIYRNFCNEQKNVVSSWTLRKLSYDLIQYHSLAIY